MKKISKKISNRKKIRNQSRPINQPKKFRLSKKALRETMEKVHSMRIALMNDKRVSLKSIPLLKSLALNTKIPRDLRENAVRVLALLETKKHSEKIVETLLQVLKKDVDANVRMHAVLGLVNLKNPNSLKFLSRVCLTDPALDVRSRAILTLANASKSKLAVDTALKMIKETDLFDRRTRLFDLTKIGLVIDSLYALEIALGPGSRIPVESETFKNAFKEVKRLASSAEADQILHYANTVYNALRKRVERIKRK